MHFGAVSCVLGTVKCKFFLQSEFMIIENELSKLHVHHRPDEVLIASRISAYVHLVRSCFLFLSFAAATGLV